MSINRVTISGNLTRDIDLRNTQSGYVIGNIGIAVNERVKNSQTDQWENYPNYINCVLFGSRAEKLSPYLLKGVKVAIDGRLRYSSWEDNGYKRSKLEVIIDQIDLMSGNKNSESQGQVIDAGEAVYSEDVPF